MRKVRKTEKPAIKEQRIWDRQGRLVKQIVGKVVIAEYSYDRKGRLKKVLTRCPDGPDRFVEYKYANG